MISNERQYSITRAELKKFAVSLAELETKSPSTMDCNDQMRHQLYLDALNSQINSFKEEIAEYERLKSGTVQKLNFDSQTDLATAQGLAEMVAISQELGLYD
jgi:HTH-type transcriptional regulator / antitoxin HipB